MKQLFILSLFILSTQWLQAQVKVNGQDINQMPEVKYVQLVGFNQSLFGKKIVVTVDYGQKTSFGESQSIEGPDGRNRVFNSMIDALNFMEANGWEYVNNTQYTINNSNVTHFLLRRSADGE